MIFKNLLRRKGRTILTLIGIAVGVAAIVALGAVAQGMKAGFTAMTRGSEADLVLTQADAMSTLLSSVDERGADELRTWREVSAVGGVLFGNTVTENGSYLFYFGYDPQGFAIEHFRIVEGQGLAEAHDVRGRPLILGESLTLALLGGLIGVGLGGGPSSLLAAPAPCWASSAASSRLSSSFVPSSP